MSGVVVTTEARVTEPVRLRAQSGQFFIVGMTERGDIASPVKVRSMDEVRTLLGNRVTYGTVHDQLKTYFAEGGVQAYVARVVGAAATVGTLTVKDRAPVTPVNTLRFDAANPGAWSGNMTLEIVDGTVANTVRILIRLSGAVVHNVNNITSPADAVAKFRSSTYVKVVDLGSATASPNNLPALTAPTAFPAGTDDRATVTVTGYVNALARFSATLKDGAVAIPGQTGSTVWNGIKDHCVAYNRIGILADLVGTGAMSYATSAKSIASEYVGLFGPHVVVPDDAGGTRTISPEGFVAAKRALAHERVGAWRLPAGLMGAASYVQDVETNFSASDITLMEDANVSPIRRVGGIIRLYGWSTLSADQNTWTYLKDRDLLNYLVYEAEARLEDYVFETIDGKGQLLSSIRAELVGMVEPIRAAGGLYEKINPDTGDAIDPGYQVNVSSPVAVGTEQATNAVHAELMVRVSPAAGMITLRIIKVGVLAPF